jgi:hypothetical protein
MKLIEYILARLAENSTWRGIILLLTALGINLNPDQSGAIIGSGLSLVGLINVFRKDKIKEQR